MHDIHKQADDKKGPNAPKQSIQIQQLAHFQQQLQHNTQHLVHSPPHHASPPSATQSQKEDKDEHTHLHSPSHHLQTDEQAPQENHEGHELTQEHHIHAHDMDHEHHTHEHPHPHQEASAEQLAEMVLSQIPATGQEGETQTYYGN